MRVRLHYCAPVNARIRVWGTFKVCPSAQRLHVCVRVVMSSVYNLIDFVVGVFSLFVFNIVYKIYKTLRKLWSLNITRLIQTYRFECLDCILI